MALALMAVARRGARRPGGGGRPGDAEPLGDPQRPDRPAHRRRALAGLLRQDRGGRIARAHRRIEPRRADRDPATRRLCRACGVRARQRRQAPDPRPRSARRKAGDRRGRRSRSAAFSATRRSIRPSCRSPSTFPFGRNPQGKLVYAKARAGDIVGLPEGAYHIVSTYLDIVGGRFLAGALRAEHRQVRGARPADDDSVELDRQRRHQGAVRQADRRDAAPPLRHADAEARQQARRRGARQHDFHRADAGRRRHPRTASARSRRWCSPKANTPSSPGTTPRPISRPSRSHSGMDRDVEVVAQERARPGGPAERRRTNAPNVAGDEQD